MFSPTNTAEPLQMIDADLQRESVRNVHLARDLKAGASVRNVADRAGDAAGVVESNYSNFEGAMTRGRSTFWHDRESVFVVPACERER